MRTYFPSTSDRTPWPAALLSLLPFFIAGPLHIMLSYQPVWTPQGRSLLYLQFLLLSSLAVAGGLALGAAKKFPRWAYPYPIYLAFSLNVLVMYAISLSHWKITGQSSLLLFLAAILIILRLPGLRAFYSQVLQDWKLLSYGLYGLVLYLLSTIDFGEAPRLSLLALLPSLLALCAALAHLRIRSAWMRVAALLAGTFAGLFFWLIPIYQGMLSAWIGVCMGSFMLLAYGITLTVILLAPMLVTGAIHAWRARHAAR